MYSPVNGKVVTINDKLIEDPAKISSDPYGKGWLIKIKCEPGTKLDHLLTLEKYQKQIESEEH
jgi:glycine cleavage system H protein